MLRFSLVPVVAAVLLVGCRSNETMAKESFGRRFTCPEDRITATPRTDLKAVDLAFRPEVPPATVAADPARLALWQKEQAATASEYDGDAVLQARGCNAEILYICGDLRVSVGATRPGCMDAQYPPTSAAAPR